MKLKIRSYIFCADCRAFSSFHGRFLSWQCLFCIVYTPSTTLFTVCHHSSVSPFPSSRAYVLLYTTYPRSVMSGSCLLYCFRNSCWRLKNVELLNMFPWFWVGCFSIVLYCCCEYFFIVLCMCCFRYIKLPQYINALVDVERL